MIIIDDAVSSSLYKITAPPLGRERLGGGQL